MTLHSLGVIVGNRMKASSLIQLVLANAVLISLVSLVRQDQLTRLDYWKSIGFTPGAIYSVFSLRYPAVNRGVAIPGLPTLDWVQLFLGVLVVIDVYYLALTLTGRSNRGENGNLNSSSIPSGV